RCGTDRLRHAQGSGPRHAGRAYAATGEVGRQERGLQAMTELFEIRDSPLDLGEVIRAVSGKQVGAIASFLGTVRDHNDGRLVTLLEYEAYRSMAEKQMRRVALGIQAEVAGVTLAALHRVGRLAVGDVAVVCAAAAAHRGEAL